MTTKWNESALPKERQFLAFARKSGLPQRSEAVRIVAKWDSYNDAFRPVRVDGDQDPEPASMFSIGSSFPRSPTSDGVRSFTRRRKRNIIRTVSRKRAHVSGMLCDLSVGQKRSGERWRPLMKH